jgi:soluble lytic murein transglycosylase-like protein
MYIAGVLAYNAGPTGARKWIASGNTPEDHWYVQRVMSTYKQLRGVDAGGKA